MTPEELAALDQIISRGLERQIPEFRSFLENYLGDKRGVPYPKGNLYHVIIPLDNPFKAQRQQAQGDLLFADRDTTGIAYVHLNRPSVDKQGFPMDKNTVLSGFPIDEIYIENQTAQPGLVLSLWYGYGAKIFPPNQATTISGTVNTLITNPFGNPVLVNDQGFAYATSFISSAAFAANTPINVWSAASNVNGAALWDAEGIAANTGDPQFTLLSKATAPASITDGDAIGLSLYKNSSGTTNIYSLKLGRSRVIPSGKRLDWIAGAAGGSLDLRSCLYTLR